MVRKNNKGYATIRRRKGTLHFHPKSPAESDVEDSIQPDENVIKVSVLQKIMSSEKRLFLGLVAFRCINALMIQTSFVPDEYWQSLEVAHNMAFGYGHMTWEWRKGLRGYTYPLLFSIVYKVLGVLRLDYAVLLVKLPRIIQGIATAFCDLYTYKLSKKLSDGKTAQYTLLCQLMSWFMFYCGPRTVTNSMETTLCVIGLYFFPWPGTSRKTQLEFILLAALSIIVRPTAAILWLPLFCWHMWMMRDIPFKMIKLYMGVGLVSVLCSFWIDHVFYGRWVFVQYNFLEFNVLHDMGSFYGSHPAHWYLTQGLPVVLATHTIPFLMGLPRIRHPAVLAIIVWLLFAYSMLGHKEFRFIMPILPLCMHICGRYISYVVREWGKEITIEPLHHLVPNLPPDSTIQETDEAAGDMGEGMKDTEETSKPTEETSQDNGETAKDTNESISIKDSSDVPKSKSKESENKSDVKPESIDKSDENKSDKPDATTNESAITATNANQESKLDPKMKDGSDEKIVNDSDSNDQNKSMGKETKDKSNAKSKHFNKTSQKKSQKDANVSKSHSAISCFGKIHKIRLKELKKQLYTLLIVFRNYKFVKVLAYVYTRWLILLQPVMKLRYILAALLMTNLPIALYTCLLHQRGTIDVMRYLATEAGMRHNKAGMDVMFLMPCHSTPYYSYIHHNISMNFLTCEPNLDHLQNYTDEADLFYQNPKHVLRQTFHNASSLPTHLVMFNTLHSSLLSLLGEFQYRDCAKFFHAHIIDDSRVGSHVIVACRSVRSS
ncbi:unnamed protein product [Owenia fusiformis]|uniref:Mannosyltransferase n=1 Tax=Owenia fusiformis TaxID=6347 RepID=A0A8J1U7W3_OWEFU|nr:unnamed protein product [Owenia fusiformis]